MDGNRGTVRLRRGVPADAGALARLHVAVWRGTYRDLAPPEALRRLDEARRLPFWQEVLGSDDPQTGAIVAPGDQDPVGVVSFAPSSHPAFAGAPEITHLYLCPSVRGSGLGASLLNAAFAHLRAAGFDRVALAVVRENTAARGFYRAMGGTEQATFTDPGPMWRSSNIVVGWCLN